MQKKSVLLFLLFACFILKTHAQSLDALQHLQTTYPDKIDTITSTYIVWKDGKRTPIKTASPIADWFFNMIYGLDTSFGSFSNDDVIHDNYEPFFKKMYGKNSQEVRKKLVKIYWMPHVFGNQYPLYVTTINGVNKKLQDVSNELEKLPPSYYQYLEKPASSFYWRKVAGQGYLSMHSFGIAIDINLKNSNYWLWDFQKLKKPISELKHHQIKYQNKIPLQIVQIFQKHGFFWGGNWYFYDTMHFEYRPELLDTTP